MSSEERLGNTLRVLSDREKEAAITLLETHVDIRVTSTLGGLSTKMTGLEWKLFT